MERLGQLTEGGGHLLQSLVMLTQKGPLAGDHLAESLCVCWVHAGQFVLLREYGTWGPKC